MGCGKSSAAINFIKKAPQNQKFLYITPFLAEVKRVIEGCPGKRIKEPPDTGSKLKTIKSLIRHGYNIASTHALFRRFDEEMINDIGAHNYTLILDEVSEVVEIYDISDDDLKDVLTNYAVVDEKNILHWTATSYQGKFDECKMLCDLGCLALYGDKVMLWLFPINVFSAFKEVYILTYLFDAQIQKHYFDLYGINYEPIFVSGDSPSNYMFTASPVTYPMQNYRDLIHICDDDKLNLIGSMSESALSYSWYKQRATPKMFNTLKKNLYNYFYNKMRSPSKNNLWTAFKPWRSELSGKGYAKGFLSHNARATNLYRDRTVLAYAINKYMQYGIRNFFISNGVVVDEDNYALSEMLQWIWRSAIRDDKEIWIYIPSVRMRNLLKKWVEENSVPCFKDDEAA